MVHPLLLRGALDQEYRSRDEPAIRKDSELVMPGTFERDARKIEPDVVRIHPVGNNVHGFASSYGSFIVKAHENHLNRVLPSRVGDLNIQLKASDVVERKFRSREAPNDADEGDPVGPGFLDDPIA